MLANVNYNLTFQLEMRVISNNLQTSMICSMWQGKICWGNKAFGCDVRLFCGRVHEEDGVTKKSGQSDNKDTDRLGGGPHESDDPCNNALFFIT